MKQIHQYVYFMSMMRTNTFICLIYHTFCYWKCLQDDIIIIYLATFTTFEINCIEIFDCKNVEKDEKGRRAASWPSSLIRAIIDDWTDGKVKVEKPPSDWNSIKYASCLLFFNCFIIILSRHDSMRESRVRILLILMVLTMKTYQSLHEHYR